MKQPKMRPSLRRCRSSEPTAFSPTVTAVTSQLAIGGRHRRRLTPDDLPFHASSTRIQFRSLQRPRKKPLQEYYNDDDAELEGELEIS
jgi:hypothetical protein